MRGTYLELKMWYYIPLYWTNAPCFVATLTNEQLQLDTELKKNIHRNLKFSQTFCISSFSENYHVTNTPTNTFICLAAALIRKEICR